MHLAASEFEAIAIRDLLEAAGVHAMVRSRVVPGYGVPTMAGDQAGVVAEILVPPEQRDEACALIADYLAALGSGTDTGEEEDSPP